MAWTKGAVVIVKRGDQEWADAMEESLDIPRGDDREMKELENENKELKRDNDLSKIHDTRFTDMVIESLEHDYGRTRKSPKWAQIVKQGFALIVYVVSVFFDKFLTIK